jgi:hypothetical protein
MHTYLRRMHPDGSACASKYPTDTIGYALWIINDKFNYMSLHAQMFALQLRLGGPRHLTVDYVPLLRLCSVTFLDGCQLKVHFNVFHKGGRYRDKMPHQQEVSKVSRVSKYKCFRADWLERNKSGDHGVLTERWVGNTDYHTAFETECF